MEYPANSHTEGHQCPACGFVLPYRNPIPTVDIVIEVGPSIVLIERSNPPPGWALPGGFVDYGESLEAAAEREAFEETSLKIQRLRFLGVYSEPKRDPRFHTVTTVFIAEAIDKPKAGDDAARAGLFKENTLPRSIAFDHRKILSDYFRLKRKS